jgi:hypothetical protein
MLILASGVIQSWEGGLDGRPCTDCSAIYSQNGLFKRRDEQCLKVGAIKAQAAQAKAPEVQQELLRVTQDWGELANYNR